MNFGSNAAPTAGTGITVSGTAVSLAAPAVNSAPRIVAIGNLAAQTGAIASLATYTTGATDETIMVSGDEVITIIGTGVGKIQVTYTDSSNTSRTIDLWGVRSDTGAQVAGITAGAAVACYGFPTLFRAKTATAVTLAVLNGGTGTFNVTGWIARVN